MLETLGETIVVFNNWKQPNETSFEVIGLKNNEKGKPDKVMFQFKDRIDVHVGSVLRLKLGSDLWRVVDTEDTIIADTFIHFEAKVAKMLPDGSDARPTSRGQAVFNAPVYGGVQVGGQQNVQSVNVNTSADVSILIEKLIETISKSPVPELDREDAVEALKRVQELSTKPQTQEVVERIKARLEIVKTAIELVKDLAPVALPLLGTLAKSLGIG